MRDSIMAEYSRKQFEMEVPVRDFNDEQRLWYGYLVASAVKADGAVDPSEIEFLIKALHFLDPKQKNMVQQYLKTVPLLPGLEKVPAGLNRKQLAVVYTELIWVIIADGVLTKSEKLFLQTVAVWFEFSNDYTGKLLQWGEQMLKAEKYRRVIVEKA